MRPLAAILCLASLSACGGPPEPTVLLVTVDTLRADRTSAFGHDLDTTPALAALAARGAAFDRALSVQPETGPSLAAIHTSRWPRELGVRANGDVLPAAFPTLAAAFADAGYETAAFVSSNLLTPGRCGLDRGFGTYDAEMTRPNLGPGLSERRAEETAERAVAWLATHAGRPRFLWVHFYDPHGKYDPGPDLAERFRRRTGRPLLDPARLQDYQRFGDSLDPDDYDARYDGEIRRADDALARLLAAAGPGALACVTADHGEGLGEHDYWYRHGSRLDGPALRVPLVFAGPGVEQGTRWGGLSSGVDVAPTLLALAGRPALPGARGRALLPAGAADRCAFAEARPTGLLAVTEGSWRLVLHPASARAALFDLASDPEETRDAAGDAPETAARLRRALEDWAAAADRSGADEVPADVDDALRSHGYMR